MVNPAFKQKFLLFCQYEGSDVFHKDVTSLLLEGFCVINLSSNIVCKGLSNVRLVFGKCMGSYSLGETSKKLFSR